MSDAIKCPQCQAEWMAPTQQGDLVIRCPTCQYEWEWRPGHGSSRVREGVSVEEPMQKRLPNEQAQARSSKQCRYCGGKGVVSGVVDDVEFEFDCPCSGGNEEAVRWLLA